MSLLVVLENHMFDEQDTVNSDLHSNTMSYRSKQNVNHTVESIGLILKGKCVDYFVYLFDLIIYVPSTIFQFNREGSSWVEQVLS